MTARIFLFWSLVSLLAACATSPNPDPVLNAQPTAEAIANGRRVPVVGTLLTWGGTVQAVHNGRDKTLVEILQYPLDSGRRPILGRRAGGRFVVDMDGFIEPAELPIGRAVTVNGRYVGLSTGPTGALPRLHGLRFDLWERPPAPVRRSPEVHFGIGVGTGGGSVGVGIGL